MPFVMELIFLAEFLSDGYAGIVIKEQNRNNQDVPLTKASIDAAYVTKLEEP
jgi:hypothetical protein